MAKTLKAKLTALHVILPFRALAFQLDMIESTQALYADESAERANEYLSFVTKVAKAAGVECDLVNVTSDKAFKAIIDTAKKRQCDLIVMASHGRRGVEGFLLGSETQKVLTHSQVPVLVCR